MRNQKLKALSLLVGSIIIAGGVVFYAANWVRKVAKEKADHQTYSRYLCPTYNPHHNLPPSP